MDNRDHILISWPSRDIEGIIFPVIQELSERFNIIVFVLTTSNLDLLKTKLDRPSKNSTSFLDEIAKILSFSTSKTRREIIKQKRR